jgi:hypothetical protein
MTGKIREFFRVAAMNSLGSLFSPLLMLTATAAWHRALLWLFWRIARDGTAAALIAVLHPSA